VAVLDVPVEDGGPAREEAAFIGTAGELFLSFLHLPHTPARGCVVICPSLYQDAFATYRQEVALARRLASAGFAVARPHYRGVGNSDDPPDGITTAATMTADLEVLLSHAEQRCEFATDQPRIGFVAVGYGAIAAAPIARSRSGAPVVLWSPATAGRQYYRDLFRAGKVAATRGVNPETAEASLLETLQEQGEVEVMGQLVRLPAFEDAEPRKLVDELGDTPRDILLAQMGYSERLDRQYDRLVKDWQESGLSVDVAVFKQQGGWWFVDADWTGDESEPVFLEFVNEVMGWFSKRWAADSER
jgi:pimeloyl-ACP methyl ester carboxylesterase